MINIKDNLENTIKLMKTINFPKTVSNTKTNLKLEFVPVVFANGEDDDGPGLLAMFSNERFQYMDRIYQHNEDVVFINCLFAIVQLFNITDPRSGLTIPIERVGLAPFAVTFYNGRTMVFHKCKFKKLPCARM